MYRYLLAIAIAVAAWEPARPALAAGALQALQRMADDADVQAPAVSGAVAAPQPQAKPGSLAALFAGERIKTVFNGDAGSGQWQNAILGMPWLDPSPKVVGFDLPSPKAYRTCTSGVSDLGANSNRKGVVVLSDPKDPRYPKPGSVDLAHVAFMDMEQEGWEDRLDGYMDLVREGGFFLIAHSHAYDETIYFNQRAKVRDEITIQFMYTGKWALIAAYNNAADGNPKIPDDYPTTEWWDQFCRIDAGAAGKQLRDKGYMTNNFLLVFQKKRSR